MLLLNAAVTLRWTEAASAAPSITLRVCAGVLSAVVAIGLAAAVFAPPDSVATLAPLAVDNLAASGLGNPVAGVLFVYRSFDTLLEKVVLVLALFGVWSLAPDRLWSGLPGLRTFKQRDSVLVLLAQLLPPIGIVYGIYMAWVGASDPGGAFQGGTVLAAMWIVVLIAGLRDIPPINSQTMRLAIVVGPLVFLAIGVAGIVFAGAFLAYPDGYAKPLIVLIEATLTLSIGVTLGLLAAGPPARLGPP